MTEPDRGLLERAADCYLRLGLDAEAARCYRDARSFRRAADLFAKLGEHDEAARAYVDAGEADLAAWLLVQEAGDPVRARAVLDTAGRPSAGASVRRRLVHVRCDVAQGAPEGVALPVLADACAELARPGPRFDRYLEPWAVGLAEAVRREDQVALVFAAAVRGHRFGAARRWAQWSRDVLHTELILPPREGPAAPAGGRS